MSNAADSLIGFRNYFYSLFASYFFPSYFLEFSVYFTRLSDSVSIGRIIGIGIGGFFFYYVFSGLLSYIRKDPFYS